jgi:hypothetical protein
MLKVLKSFDKFSSCHLFEKFNISFIAFGLSSAGDEVVFWCLCGLNVQKIYLLILVFPFPRAEPFSENLDLLYDSFPLFVKLPFAPSLHFLLSYIILYFFQSFHFGALILFLFRLAYF